MPIIYKTDILMALKEAGYNTNRIRKEKLLSEGVLNFSTVITAVKIVKNQQPDSIDVEFEEK